MTASWPGGLPQKPVYGGFTEQRQRNVVAFQPEAGPPKARRRSTAVAVPATARFEMTDAQVVTFNTLFETTLVDGTLPFTWAHPRTNVSYTWMFSPGVQDAPVIESNNVDLNVVTCKLIRLP